MGQGVTILYPFHFFPLNEKKRINHNSLGSTLKDIILGGQDGLVNVLGIVLVMASATQDIRIVIIAGLAATFAESISMAAVAYTSVKAALSYYKSQLEHEKGELKKMPRREKALVRKIYAAKGFEGQLLNKVVQKIISNPKVWLNTIMTDHLGMSPSMYQQPVMSACIVGFSAVIGSLIPLIPFTFLPIQTAILWSVIISTIVLFVTGAIKAKLTIGDWKKSGAEMAVVGMSAAFIGYFLGRLLGAIP